MTDAFTQGTDPSYWDWIKQKLGLVPNGLPTYPASDASGVVTADPESTGFFGLSMKPVGEQVRDRLGMQPLTYNNPGGDTYMVDNNNPFVGPDGKYNYSDLAYALGLPGFKPSYQTAEETARANAAPDKREYAKERAAREMANVVPASPAQAYPPGPSAMPASPTQAYAPGPSAVPASPREAYAEGTSAVPASPLQAYAPGPLATAASPREAYDPNTPAAFDPNQFAGRSMGSGGLLDGLSAAAAPVAAAAAQSSSAPVMNPNDAFTPMPAPSAPVPNAPMATPQQNGGGIGDFFSKLFGSASAGDPNAINPNTGLTNAQTQLMASNMFLNLGGTLLAASQPMFGPQRAQILAKLGNAAPDPNMISQMQTRLLENNKLARQNAMQTNLLKAMQSPEFQSQFANMSPQYQALAKAAAENGDLNGVMSLIEKSQPQVANGMVINRQGGFMLDTNSGQKFDLETGNPIIDNTNGNGGKPADITQYGLPEGTRVNPIFNQFNDAYRQKLADIYYGNDTLANAGRGNSSLIQRMQMDVQRAFPDYRPLEAQNRADTLKSLANHKNGNLGAYSDSVGAMGEHFNTLVDASKDLNNAPLMYWNAAKNQFETQTGDPKQTRFATSANIYLSELAKVLKGGGVPTDTDKSEVAAMFNRNLANGQLRAGLLTMDQMARAKAESVDSTTQRTFGDLYDPKKHSVITPYAQKQFDASANNTWLHPELAQNNGPKPGDVVKGYKFKGGNPADKNNWEQQ
jgi:hypothetical protein